MNKYLRLVIMVLTAIFMVYSVIILEPKNTKVINVLLWGYLSLLALLGWAKIFASKVEGEQ